MTKEAEQQKGVQIQIKIDEEIAQGVFANTEPQIAPVLLRCLGIFGSINQGFGGRSQIG